MLMPREPQTPAGMLGRSAGYDLAAWRILETSSRPEVIAVALELAQEAAQLRHAAAIIGGHLPFYSRRRPHASE